MQQELGQLAVVIVEHAVQRFGQVVALGSHRAAGQARSALGRAPPAIIALIMSCAEIVVSLLATDDLHQRAFQRFQPLPAAGPLLDQPDPARV